MALLIRSCSFKAAVITVTEGQAVSSSRKAEKGLYRDHKKVCRVKAEKTVTAEKINGYVAIRKNLVLRRKSAQ